MNLDESAVGRLLRMEEVIPAMDRALAENSVIIAQMTPWFGTAPDPESLLH